jgi:hypothetical protein
MNSQEFAGSGEDRKVSKVSATVVLIWCVTLGLCIFVVRLILADPVISPYNTSAKQIDLSRDPVVGLPVPKAISVSKDTLGRNIKPGTHDLVVYSGYCSQCSLNSLDVTKLPTGQFDRVFLLFEGREIDAKEMLRAKKLPANTYVIVDASGVGPSRAKCRFFGALVCFSIWQDDEVAKRV